MTWLFHTITLALTAYTLFTLSFMGRSLMSTQETINQITAQLGKARDEIVTRIADLNAQIEAAGVAEQVDTSALTAAAQALDDIVAD